MESHIDLSMNYEQVKMKTFILSLQPATKVTFVYIVNKNYIFKLPVF